jgi:hypothetical protein
MCSGAYGLKPSAAASACQRAAHDVAPERCSETPWPAKRPRTVSTPRSGAKAARHRHEQPRSGEQRPARGGRVGHVPGGSGARQLVAAHVAAEDEPRRDHDPKDGRVRRRRGGARARTACRRDEHDRRSEGGEQWFHAPFDAPARPPVPGEGP